MSGELLLADHRDTASQADYDAVIEAQTPQIGLPLMGLPGLKVTTGAVGTTPVGVQLLADQFREDLLLDLGQIIGADIPVVGQNSAVKPSRLSQWRAPTGAFCEGRGAGP